MSLKSFDFKQFAITHGEKIVLGVIGLVVLIALTKTTWSTFKTKPAEVVDKAKKASETIAANKWPKEDQEKYTAANRLSGKIKDMLQPIRGGNWRASEGGGLALSIDHSYRLYVKEKLLEKPKVLPVRRLIASATKIVGAEIVAYDAGSEEGGGCCENPMGKKKTDQFKGKKQGGFRAGRSNRNKTGMGEGGSPGIGLPNSGGGMGKGGAIAGAGITPMGMGGDCGEGGGPGCTPTGMGDDYGGGGTGVVTAKGVRVIAVRGIIPIREQLHRFEEALNLPKGQFESNPRLVVHILGFKIDRQVSADGGKSWTDWEKVDRERNLKNLTELNWETDVVKPGVVHPEVTSPLIERLFRQWGPEATHPLLNDEKYKLTEEGRRRMKKLEELTAKQKELAKKTEKSFGFGKIRRDLTGQAQGLLGAGMSGGFNTGGPMTPMGPMGADCGEGDAGTAGAEYMRGLKDTFTEGDERKQAINELTAAGDLILFRYFDFDVLPGLSYRYRVKLVLRNPLFERDPNTVKLDAQKSTSQEFIESPESNVTDVTTIPADTHIFLAHVNQRLSMRLEEPRAAVRVYQWLPKLGTVVKGDLTELKIGSFVVGLDKKTTRIDPGREEMLVNAETEFETRSMVLDIMNGRRQLSRAQISELGLPRNLEKVKLFDEVMVIDDTGRLKALDPYSGMKKKSELDENLAARDKFFEGRGWKIDLAEVDRSGAAGDANCQFGSPDTGEGGCCGEGGGGKQTRRRGSRRRLSAQRRGRNSGGYGPMGPMGGSGARNSGGGRNSGASGPPNYGGRGRSRRSRNSRPGS